MRSHLRAGGAGEGRLEDAAALFKDMVLAPEFEEFLTLPAYEWVLSHGG